MNRDLKIFVKFLSPEKPAKTTPVGYYWKVIHDPTRNDHDPGLFYGGYFRLLDIIPEKNENISWPDGLIFEHQKTGQKIVCVTGQMHFLVD